MGILFTPERVAPVLFSILVFSLLEYMENDEYDTWNYGGTRVPTLRHTIHSDGHDSEATKIREESDIKDFWDLAAKYPQQWCQPKEGDIKRFWFLASKCEQH